MSDGQFVAPTIEELQPHFTQYAIEAFVAVGGMGAVFRAKQISVDRTVALKVLPPELARDPEFRSRFAMEARAMAKLSHRNLVQLYDFGQDGEVVWMTQEWIDGETVFELLQREGAMDPTEAAALVAQACEGLGYAHKQGIVHRDVKPGNMMEGEEGLLKLMDFGLARATRGGPESLQAEGRKRYATPEYAAPELWDPDREVDHRVDIFALGVLLFETLTGERPGAEFRNPSALRPGLDQRFDGIVVRALQREPENRYGTCAEFMSALRAVVVAPAKVPAKTPARTAAGKVKLMTGSTGAVTLKPSTAPAQVPQPAPGPRPTTEAVPAAPPRSNSGVIGVIAAVVVALLIIAGGGGWIWWSKEQARSQRQALQAKQQEETARVAREREAKVQRDKFAAAEARRQEAHRKKKEQERQAARKAEEERKRMAVEETGADMEDPLVTVRKEVEDLDAATREAAQDPLAAYRNTRAELTERFVDLCDAGEKKAAAAGDLDRVVFWMKERAGVKREKPGEGGDEAPDQVIAMRTEWTENLDPLIARLEELRVDYGIKIAALETGELSDEARGILAACKKNATYLSGFMDFCDGSEPREPENAEVPPVIPEVPLPDKLRLAYEKLQKSLVDMESRGDRSRMQSLIKSFGRGLAAEEKKLTMALKIPEAMAVRSAKNELLEKLRRLENGDPLAPEQRSESLVIVRNGSLTDDGEMPDRSHWKRKGRILQSRSGYAQVKSVRALGPGDFEIRLRMALEMVGASKATIWIGSTEINLDNDGGKVEILRGGALTEPVTGKGLASLVKAGEFFDCVVERKGPLLRILVNGTEVLQTKIHHRELGTVTVVNHKKTLQLESFEIVGTMIEDPGLTTLTGHQNPNGTLWYVNMVPTGDEGLLCLFAADGGENTALYARRSRNAGERWEDRIRILSHEDLNGQPLGTFGVAANPSRDTIWMVYGVGKVNQRLYVAKGRGRGHSWSKGEEITIDVKEQGWNAWPGRHGVVLQHNKRKMGRIVIPLVAGPADEPPSLYAMVSENGREWKRIGPLLEDSVHGVEIMEGPSGRLWMATGMRESPYRRWVTSEDGGDTWSEPVLSSLPNNAGSGGDLVVMPERGGKQAWLYAMVDGPPGPKPPPKTNLTLYASWDQGKTWQELRRFYYGYGYRPSIVPLGPDRCGISFLSEGIDKSTRRIRYVLLENLWKD